MFPPEYKVGQIISPATCRRPTAHFDDILNVMKILLVGSPLVTLQKSKNHEMSGRPFSWNCIENP